MRGHIDRIHENRRIAARWLFWIVGVVLFMLCSDRVHAAGGRLTIAVSDTTVPVGSEVTVVLSATSSSGERAVANMEFTYNSSVFSFVSCNAQDYSGGPGGSVSFYGSAVTVKLRAENGGSSDLMLTGSNGMIRETGEALEGLDAAGATMEVTGGTPQSGDNSLSALSLSQGELSPAFSGEVMDYTASVPYETTSLEVNAQVSHENAQVASIEGSSELQVGENTIHITVKAENGDESVYTIVVTRAETPSAPPEDGDTQPSDGETTPQEPEPEDGAKIEEYEKQLTEMKEQYQQLMDKYKAEKSSSRKVMAVLIFVVVVLVILCVNIIIFRRRKDDEEEGEDEPVMTRASRRREKKQEKAALKEEEFSFASSFGQKKQEQEKEEEPESKPSFGWMEKEAEKAPEKEKEPKAIEKEEKPEHRRLFKRREKEAWLDDEDVDMESAIFSTTVIPAPRKQDGAPEETVNFIDLDEL